MHTRRNLMANGGKVRGRVKGLLNGSMSPRWNSKEMLNLGPAASGVACEPQWANA